ncbi:hypothetical protein [Aromatoleum evansii]|uniref:hypothetical protein n=1 Tax=Aromatoleum evansii TaxID=59406 RepID=UPI00145CF1C3|nr:hypothetical protein [Aromatoleum evansii]NMG31087.1 hypothetical protein [Aromatoleum evansii]
MAQLTLHREDCELRGKKLSANTLASFLVVQHVASVSDLTTDRSMNGAALRFLNRDRAIGYWRDMDWIEWNGSGYTLTRAGLDEALNREAGIAVNEQGKKKAGNVTPEQVRQARMFILHGGAATAPILTAALALP